MGFFQRALSNRKHRQRAVAHGVAYNQYKEIFSRLTPEQQRSAIVKVAQTLILAHNVDWSGRRVAVQAGGGLAVFGQHNHLLLPVHLLRLSTEDVDIVTIMTSELQNDTHPVSQNPLRRQSVVTCDRDTVKCWRGAEAVEFYRSRGRLGDEVSCVHGGRHWPWLARETAG